MAALSIQPRPTPDVQPVVGQPEDHRYGALVTCPKCNLKAHVIARNRLGIAQKLQRDAHIARVRRALFMAVTPSGLLRQVV